MNKYVNVIIVITGFIIGFTFHSTNAIIVVASVILGLVLRPAFDTCFATVTNAINASKLSSFEKEYASCAERLNEKITPEMERKLFLQKNDNTIWTVIKIDSDTGYKFEFCRCPNEEKKRGF